MTAAPETIFALSSGRPPAAVAVVRVSGPAAGAALESLTGRSFPPRRAVAAALRDPEAAELLDHALVLWLPGPGTATGEDVAELHLHGGRAVIDGVLGALAARPDLRPAAPGEFTRRAFENGRIDLNEAEGLADLLASETAGQRRAALLAAGGALSRSVADWRTRLLGISAQVEAAIDYSEEDDVAAAEPSPAGEALRQLAAEMDAVLARPTVERLHDGVRVVVAGPPNSGKSSLVNALSGRDAAIASPVAGTTRDLIEVPLSIAGVPLILIDTAGLRRAEDAVEEIGVRRAADALAAADLVLWLGDGEPPAPNSIKVQSFADLLPAEAGRLPVSSLTGENLPALLKLISERASRLMPPEGEIALNRRQHDAVAAITASLRAASEARDPLIAADELRSALRLCDALTGRAGVEDMLDALFGRFCIGK